jgi:hypothetical protein
MSNALNIKMTLTTIPNLLPHGSIYFVFLEQADVVDIALLLIMVDDVLMKERGPLGSTLLI